MLLTVIVPFLLLVLFFAMNRKPWRRVFLLDFACYKPPASQMCTSNDVAEQATQYAMLTEENSVFCRKTIERAGLGDSTYLPECLLERPCNPYNLSGMGCSAGLTAIGLAKQLQVHPNSYALVVSTENITENAYKGQDRSMMLINCLFRVGGAAILLSNRQSDCQSSNYELIQTVHTHTAGSDRSYNSIIREEDQEGLAGITITKDIIIAANKAIETNLTMLGSKILPVGEKLWFTINYMMRKLRIPKVQVYVPDFKKVIDHFCTHVGGKPVMDELQRNLGFSDFQMEPSRMTMYRFGNTSSSSVWYAMAYAEAKGRIKRGDRVWQIAFGSGFKCSSVVWRAIRSIDYDETNPWTAEIDQFPVRFDHLGSFPYFLESSKAA